MNPDVRADPAMPLYGARTLSDGFVLLLPTCTKTASVGTHHSINKPIVPTTAPTDNIYQTTPQEWISDFLFSKYALWGSFMLAAGFTVYHFADQLCAFLLRWLLRLACTASVTTFLLLLTVHTYHAVLPYLYGAYAQSTSVIRAIDIPRSETAFMLLYIMIFLIMRW